MGDGPVDGLLMLDHAAHHLGEEGLVGLGQPLAFHVGVEPVIGELAHHRLHAGGGDLHLIERLHRRQAGHGAGPAFPGGEVGGLGAGFALGLAFLGGLQLLVGVLETARFAHRT